MIRAKLGRHCSFTTTISLTINKNIFIKECTVISNDKYYEICDENWTIIKLGITSIPTLKNIRRLLAKKLLSIISSYIKHKETIHTIFFSIQ